METSTRFYKPSVTDYTQTDYSYEGCLKFVTKCVGVCRDKDLSKKDPNEFVHQLFDSGHTTPIELATMYLKIPNDIESLDKKFQHMITMLLENKYGVKITKDILMIPFLYVYSYIQMIDDFNSKHVDEYLDFLNSITIPNLTNNEELEDFVRPERLTFLIDTNIGTMREINRYRTHSIVEQSTRYCNYSRDKGGIPFSVPCDMDYDYICSLEKKVTEEGVDWKEYNNTLENVSSEEVKTHINENMFVLTSLFSNHIYTTLVNGYNRKLDDVRWSLPLTTRTKAYHTATIRDWMHFIDQRMANMSGKAHLDAQFIAKEVFKYVHNYMKIDRLNTK